MQAKNSKKSIMTSALYKQNLMKQYKVIQALKASNRVTKYESSKSFMQQIED